MKSLGMVLASFVGLTLTAAAGRGDGGPPTGTPVIIGGGTTGGTDPETSNPEWKAIILAAYADAAVSPSERKEIKGFLRSLPPRDRFRYTLSWTRLKSQVARNEDPLVISGVVAAWAATDPAGAAGWLNNLPGR